MGAIRLFLAIAVVVAHTNSQGLGPIGLKADFGWIFGLRGPYAVVFFYMISGFLISFVLDAKYAPTLAGTRRFYKARFLRIFPLWWAAVAFSLAVVVPHALTWLEARSSGELISMAFLFGSDWLVPFGNYPSGDWDVFPRATDVGWTLGAELSFYLMAPLLFRSLRATIALFLASAIVRVVVVSCVDPQNIPVYMIWTYFFFPSTIMFFLAGHLARQLYKRFAIDRRLGAALLLLVPLLTLQTIDRPFDNAYFYLAAACFALALPAVFALTKDSRAMNFMGDLTYPLYLTHRFTIAAIFSPWSSGTLWLSRKFAAVGQTIPGPYLQSATMTSAVLICALSAAFLAHFFVERPLIAVMSRMIALVGRGVRRARPLVRGAGGSVDSRQERLRS